MFVRINIRQLPQVRVGLKEREKTKQTLASTFHLIIMYPKSMVYRSPDAAGAGKRCREHQW